MFDRTCGCIRSGIQVSQQRWRGVQRFAANAKGLFAHCSRHRTCCSLTAAIAVLSLGVRQGRHVLNPRGPRLSFPGSLARPIPHPCQQQEKKDNLLHQPGRMKKAAGQRQQDHEDEQQQQLWHWQRHRCLQSCTPARPCSGRGGSAGEGQVSVQGCAFALPSPRP